MPAIPPIRRRFARAASSAGLALLALLIGGVNRSAIRAAQPPSAAPAASPTATPDAAWDAAFARLEGWTGGDVVGSVDIGAGRVLWLFGDTWVGRVADGRHVDSRLVNNTIAVEDRAGIDDVAARQRGRAPTPASLRFHWRNEQGGNGQGGNGQAPGKPAAWIAPPAPKRSERGEPLEWYWFTGGGASVTAPDGGERAVVFLFHIGKQANNEGVWGFESRGSALATIDRLAEPVDRWVVTQHQIPFAIDAAAHRANPALEETAWGVAAWREPASEPGHPERLYIYGTRGGDPRKLLLARVPANAVAEFESWSFYAGAGRWARRTADATPIADGVPAELSVEQGEVAGQRRFAMVHSEPYLGRRIFLRSAERPEGPWSSPAPIYTAPEPAENKQYFAYAAKGHWPLSPPGELLVSYVVNSHDFGAMVGDASIYRPRFVRVSLDALPPTMGPSLPLQTR